MRQHSSYGVYITIYKRRAGAFHCVCVCEGSNVVPKGVFVIFGFIFELEKYCENEW